MDIEETKSKTQQPSGENVSSDPEKDTTSDAGKDTCLKPAEEVKTVGNLPVVDIPMEIEEKLLGDLYVEPEKVNSKQVPSGTEESDTGVVASELKKLSFKEKKKLSGAQQRKKRKALKEAEMGVKGSETPRTSTTEKQKDPSKPSSSKDHSRVENLRRESENVSAASPKKRGRTDGSTPDSIKGWKPPNKRGKIHKTATAGADYSAALSSIKAAVTCENYPETRLTEEQMLLTQQSILDKIHSGMAIHPQFQGSKFEQGALLLYCKNDETWRWLENLVPQLTPWEGAKLKAILAKDLIQLVKVIFEAPSELKKADSDVILSKIEGQNGGLSTKNWKILQKKETDKGLTVVCLLDKDSVEVLDTRMMRIFLGFHTVKFTILDKKREN